MLAFSILFAIGGYAGSGKGLDVPDWFNYIIFPLGIILISFFWWRKGK
jgi:hypothetical protein